MKNPRVAFVLAIVFLDVIGFGIVIPVMPRLVQDLGGGDPAHAARVLGVFGMTWALMQFFFSPVLGVLSDRFGRRPVLLISCAGLGLDYLLMAMAPSLGWLYLGRIINGITAATFSTASAYITDITPPEKRASAFGLIGAAFGLGFIVGPAIGGLLGDLSPRAPFWVTAVLGLLGACYGFFLLPESLPRERRSSFEWRRANPLGALKLLRSHHELFGLASVGFLFQLAHHVLPSVFVLYTSYRYGWSTGTTGFTLGLVGASNLIVQAFLVKPIVAALGERRTLFLSLAAATAGYSLAGLATTSLLFMLTVPVMAFMGLFTPASQGLMTRRVAGHEQGQLQGAIGSIVGLTGLVGPGMFSFTLAFFIDAEGIHQPGAPFLLAGLVAAIALPLAVRVTRAGADDRVGGPAARDPA